MANVGSPFGTAHQAGNVWEWVEDWWAPYQPGLESGSTRDKVMRGGSYWVEADCLRSTCRNWAVPEYRVLHVGFRCARGPSRQP